MKYRFGDFVLDDERFELTDSSNNSVPLQMRSLELLLLLIRHAGATVTKETILQEVWGGLHVSRSAIPTQVLKLRKAIEDAPASHSLIQSVPRKGLRFTGEVEQIVTGTSVAAQTPESTPDQGSELVLESKLIGEEPKIAILQFRQLGESANLVPLTLALPTDIINTLSRFRILKVTAAASSFLLDQNAISPRNVGMLLGVDYCLTGHVSALGENYNIYAELSDANTEQIVWSGQFEVEPRDIHSLLSNIVGQIASHVENQVSRHQAKQLRLLQPDSLTAWQAFHIGSALTHRRGEANMIGARTYFKRATMIDPGFAKAWSGLAHTYAFEAIHSPQGQRQLAKRHLVKSAERALEADPDDPTANLFMGRAISIGQLAGDPQTWFETALDLSPSYAMAHQQLGSGHVYKGDVELAIEHSTASVRLNPYGPLRYSNYAALAMAHSASGDMAQAIEWGLKAGAVPFDDLMIMVVGLCAFHVAGKPEEASHLAGRIRNAFPQVTRRDIATLESSGSASFSPIADSVLEAHGFS